MIAAIINNPIDGVEDKLSIQVQPIADDRAAVTNLCKCADHVVKYDDGMYGFYAIVRPAEETAQNALKALFEPAANPGAASGSAAAGPGADIDPDKEAAAAAVGSGDQ